MAKIVKRRGSQLEVRVRKTRPREVVGPCQENCNSPYALRISFITHTRKRYVDSSSTLVGIEHETTANKTICVDKRIFFKRSHLLDYHMIISAVLDTLNVKAASLQDSITAQIMSMGESKYKGGKKVKRKISKGLHVDLTWIKTFLGDRDSVHQLFEEEMEEYGMEPSDKGVHFVL
ncbi:hypothetical protein POM88_003707 [Heracleum sosnowskyi]|uniref:Uncharacterized protein n=1 Tax=Heracleum sosnowskyi TaxID=360622 RepID=A0AAD8NCL7_9APIA|nr:hypothetical protein POM88_003707 [Heracleum sosnowskyi]